MRIALVIVAYLLTAACSATGPGPRPLERGFATGAGVADPYEDGKRHLADGRYDLAAQRFGQAVASDRRSLDALNGLAIAYTLLGRFESAQTYFERALQIDATSALTLNNYGWSLVEQGRLRDAKPFLERALHRAADAELPVIAGNIERVAHALPPALVAALDGRSGPQAHGYRLVRIGANVHRLDSGAGRLAGRLAQAGAAQASAERFRAAESDLDLPVHSYSGDALNEIRPEPVSNSEAAATLAGEKT